MAGQEIARIEPRDGGAHLTAPADRPMIGGLIRPLAAAAQVLQVQEEIRALIGKILQEGRDYATIPGTKDKSLLQPGGERINMALGCYPRHRVLEAEIDHDRPVYWIKTKRDGSSRSGESLGIYRYVVECELVHRDTGLVVGQAIGSCSTMESKYVDRPRDSENTVLQMAEKRAYLRVTRNTWGLSDMFTQDIDEDPERFGRERQGGNRRSDTADASGSFLDSKAPGKNAGGKTWRELCHGGKDGRGYVHWAVRNMDRLTDTEKAELEAECAAAKALEEKAAGQGALFETSPAKKALVESIEEAVEAGAITVGKSLELGTWLENVDAEDPEALAEIERVTAGLQGAIKRAKARAAKKPTNTPTREPGEDDDEGAGPAGKATAGASPASPTANGTTSGTTEPAASEEQLREIRELLTLEAISDDVRQKLVARMEDGLTARGAVDAIAYLKRLVNHAGRQGIDTTSQRQEPAEAGRGRTRRAGARSSASTPNGKDDDDLPF